MFYGSKFESVTFGFESVTFGSQNIANGIFFQKKVYSDFEVQAGFIKYVLYLYLVGKLKICMTYNSQSIA